MVAFMAHLLIVAVIFYSVICRARHMDSRTKGIVRWQHAFLSTGALASLVVPIEWAPGAIGAGVAVFLVLGAARWRGGAPAGIARVDPKPAYFRKPWAG